jgi:hypothetical protein
MIDARNRRILQGSCVATLVALGLMAWSEIVPKPLPVIVAMTVAQGIGTLSLVAFAWVVVSDIRTARKRARESERPPPVS